MTHTSSWRETLTSDLPASIRSHVATLTTSLILKDGDSYTQPPGQCLWLEKGTARHPAPSPKFLAPQVPSALIAKAHGYNREGYVLNLESLGCLIKKADSWASHTHTHTHTHTHPFWICGLGQEICLLNKRAQIILSEADFELHPFRTKSLKRKSTWKWQQYPPPSQNHWSISSWDLGMAPYFLTYLLPFYPFSSLRKFLICQTFGLFCMLSVTLAWWFCAIHLGKGDQARGPDKWAEQNREERTPLEEMPRLGLAYVKNKNKNKNKNKTKTKAKTKKKHHTPIMSLCHPELKYKAMTHSLSSFPMSSGCGIKISEFSHGSLTGCVTLGELLNLSEI